MTNPPFILDHLDEIAKILSHPRVFSWLHVPVQSGSDKVLKRMNREYTSSEFMRVADFLKARIPEVIIATDIICGFPGESEEDFQDTMRMVQKYQFGIMNISQFYPRPGTVVFLSQCSLVFRDFLPPKIIQVHPRQR
jgi:threonylcarbamoyladenosine tRNA methylthiotransferase CDKAL1